MRQSGVNLQVHYIPVHLQPYYKKKFDYKLGDFSVAEKFYNQEISLPIYPELSDGEVSLIIESIMQNLSL